MAGEKIMCPFIRLTKFKISPNPFVTSTLYASIGLTLIFILPPVVVAQFESLDIVIYAETNVTIKDNAQITSGNTFVNINDGRFLLRNSASHEGNVHADKIVVRSGALLQGNATFNNITNQGTINGIQNSPLTVPLIVP